MKTLPIDNYFVEMLGRFHRLISATKCTDEDLEELEKFYSYINYLLKEK